MELPRSVLEVVGYAHDRASAFEHVLGRKHCRVLGIAERPLRLHPTTYASRFHLNLLSAQRRASAAAAAQRQPELPRSQRKRGPGPLHALVMRLTERSGNGTVHAGLHEFLLASLPRSPGAG